MSENSRASHGVQFGELARATEGMTQWRPLLLGFVSLLLASTLMAGSGAAMASMRNIGGVILGVLIAVLALVVMLGGFSAVGVMLMDKARNLAPRSIGDACMLGLLCIPKFLLFGVLLALIVAVFMAVAALLYLLCKIPYLGALLAFFIHPALVLVAAFLIVALIFVALPLFAPAVWSGLGFKEALSSLVAIAQKRLVQVVLMWIVLYLIVLVVAALLFAGLVPAVSGMTSLATSIMSPYGSLGRGFSFESLMMGMMGVFGGGTGSGAMASALAGVGVLMTAVSAMLTQVWLMGFNLMYLQAANGVDASQAASGLGKLMDDIKTRAEAAKDSAVAAAARAQQAAAERAAALKAQQADKEAKAEEVAAEMAVGALVCPACQAAVQSQDVFCGECGHKLGQ